MLLALLLSYPYEGEVVLWLGPNWTPEGKIVFLEEREVQAGHEDKYIATLCQIDRDGSNLTRIVRFSNYIPPTSGVFTAATDSLVIVSTGAQMFLVERKTGKLLKDLGQGAYANFSPDGKRIVYQKYEGYSPKGIWVMDLESGRERCLVPDTDATYPDWSPSGKYIVYDVCPRWDFARTFIVDTLGNLVYDSLPYLEAPDWSWRTDSLLIGAGDRGIVILHLPARKVEALSFQGLESRWSPDGKWLIIFTVHDGFRGYLVVNKEGTNWVPLCP